jgi:hypothetical protein
LWEWLRGTGVVDVVFYEGHSIPPGVDVRIFFQIAMQMRHLAKNQRKRFHPAMFEKLIANFMGKAPKEAVPLRQSPAARSAAPAGGRGSGVQRGAEERNPQGDPAGPWESVEWMKSDLHSWAASRPFPEQIAGMGRRDGVPVGPTAPETAAAFAAAPRRARMPPPIRMLPPGGYWQFPNTRPCPVRCGRRPLLFGQSRGLVRARPLYKVRDTNLQEGKRNAVERSSKALKWAWPA